MWRSISHSIRRKRNLTEPAMASHDLSDDETSSNASLDEGLECPICCESFNIVENVPYVLWCGHTLCKNCVLGLSTHKIRAPFLVSCPWCNLPTFRVSHRSNLKLPRKNFFLLWMVESRHGDRVRRSPAPAGGACLNRRMHRLGRESLHKSIDYFFRMTSKFPLVLLLFSGAVLVIYLAIAIVVAVPSFLVLYFSCPALDWLGREMRT